MKKIIGVIFVLSLLAVRPTSAQFGMMDNFRNFGGNTSTADKAAVKNTLQEIYQSQNITSSAQLNCEQISDEQFEKLGDSYMELVHPGSAHIYMDQMMGGEGSVSLKQTHINMGRSYAGCWSGYNAAPLGLPISGYSNVLNNNDRSGYFPFGMMGPWMMGGFGGGYNWFGLLTMILFWALLILGLAAIIKQFFKK